ncbi:hypothetical protein [Burkholderia plantarii]|uniref:hypothetical protein n=1 Tax=Burkholderia plantarii TaxID=41899 RepID=UPI0018DB909C|nr:hypothetical protein [Burkholderia plantarii]MBI0327852.1 hypothetical protein [Burkholderia plantarii]
MTLALHIDWATGAVDLEQVRIAVDASGALVHDVRLLCHAPESVPNGVLRYRVAKPVALCGYAAQCVFDVGGGRIEGVAVWFDLIRFFKASITESKIVQAVAAASGLQVINPHPAKATLEPCAWGTALFSFDPRQGDLTLDLQYA